MIAIHTKYLPCTNTKGSRIKAFTSTNKAAVIPYPHELSFELAHFKAVKALVELHGLEWNLNDMRFGDSADGRGYVFCFDASRVSE